MDTATQTRAAIYVRISKDTEYLGLGVSRQTKDCTALAAKNGWGVVKVYEDNDISAFKKKARPAYEQMTRAVEAGSVNAIIVWDVDRLTRTPRELEGVIDWADQYGLKLASVGGEIDLATPQGRMMARVKGAVARYEVEQQSRRLRAKMLELAESGKYTGPRPYGWDFGEEGSLVINETEAAVVREAYARVLSGDTLYAITRDLQARGTPTRKGGPWRQVSLRGLLLRWANCGVKMHKGKEMGPGDWPPLVSREDHERLVARLSDPARRSQKGTKAVHLLSGLLECARCGGPLYNRAGYVREGGKLRPAMYRCPRQRGCGGVGQNREALDEFVTELVLGLMEKGGVRALHGDQTAAKKAQDQVESIKSKLNLVADQFAEDLITGEQLKRISGRLREDLAKAEARAQVSMPHDAPEALAGVNDVRSAWERASTEDRRSLIKVLMRAGLRIRVSPPGRTPEGIAFNLDMIDVKLPGEPDD